MTSLGGEFPRGMDRASARLPPGSRGPGSAQATSRRVLAR
jgi:hypothetical protein